MDARLVPPNASPDLPRFARGFVVADAAFEPPVHDWISQEIAGLWLSRAPEVPLTTARSGERSVVVLGQFVDTESWLSPESAVARAADALAHSELAFLDATDAWCGRYIIIFGTELERHVMTDATGMRSAFYALDGPLVLASHARLAATLVAAEPSPLVDAYRAIVRRRLVPPRRRSPVMSMPGRMTPWSGIVYLTANMILDLETRRLRRIFPRRPMPHLTAAAAADLIAPRMRGQVTAMVESGRPVVISITSGMDSRVTVAASRDAHDALRYFTYRRDDVPEDVRDVAVASAICEAMHLRYGVLDVGSSVEPPELDAVIREATFLSHGRSVVAAYRAAFSPDTMHIRSNIGEVGRSFYRRSMDGAAMPTAPMDISAGDLVRLWARGDVDEPTVESAFAEWMDATSFRDVAELDALEVFYWEHRMSCWHSNVVLESDFAFDTHVLFNSRWILERMLSLPAGDRARGMLFRHLVARMWPELARWPMGAPPRKRTWRSMVGSIRRRVAAAARTSGRH